MYTRTASRTHACIHHAPTHNHPHAPIHAAPLPLGTHSPRAPPTNPLAACPPLHGKKKSCCTLPEKAACAAVLSPRRAAQARSRDTHPSRRTLGAGGVATAASACDARPRTRLCRRRRGPGRGAPWPRAPCACRTRDSQHGSAHMLHGCEGRPASRAHASFHEAQLRAPVSASHKSPQSHHSHRAHPARPPHGMRADADAA